MTAILTPNISLSYWNMTADWRPSPSLLQYENRLCSLLTERGIAGASSETARLEPTGITLGFRGIFVHMKGRWAVV